MALEQPNFELRDVNKARQDIIFHPIYQAGSLDGFIYTSVRNRPWGYEFSVHGDSTSTNVSSIWHSLTNCEGALSANGTRWSLYNMDSIQKLFADPIPYLMVLRKEEVIRFLQALASVRIINTGEFNAARVSELQYYLDFYEKYKNGNYNISPISELSPHYLAGLFEMSPKGTIRFESPAKFNSRGRMVVQIATPQLNFAEYMSEIYGGGSFTIKEGASYLWKVTGKKAEAFLEKVLIPNSAWGESVLLHKVRKLEEVEQ